MLQHVRQRRVRLRAGCARARAAGGVSPPQAPGGWVARLTLSPYKLPRPGIERDQNPPRERDQLPAAAAAWRRLPAAERSCTTQQRLVRRYNHLGQLSSTPLGVSDAAQACARLSLPARALTACNSHEQPLRGEGSSNCSVRPGCYVWPAARSNTFCEVRPWCAQTTWWASAPDIGSIWGVKKTSQHCYPD